MIDVTLLKKFLKLAGDQLTGDWVLMGGTVLPLLGIHYRTTVDIDLVGTTEKQLTQNLKLMEIAETLKLPVETINQAGAYFLHKLPNFRDHLIVLHHGKHATLFRPDLELFIELKMDRLSDTDYHDCVEFIRYVKANNESFDHKRIIKKLTRELKMSENESKKKKLTSLIEAI